MKDCFSKKSPGFAAIMAVTLVTAVSLIFSAGFLFTTLRNTERFNAQAHSVHSYYASEAGIEDAVYRLKKNFAVPASYTLPVGSSTASVTVSGGGSQKTIVSTGDDASHFRKTQAQVALTEAKVEFVFGAHIGDGGIEIQNSSKIVGNVYSNGPVVGNNSFDPRITGDAFAAGTSSIQWLDIGGSAWAHSLSNLQVATTATSTTNITSVTTGADAHADTITGSTIGNDAYYQTSISGSTVGGSSFPGTPAPTDLPNIPLSISDAQLDAWEAEAQAGGTITSPCPYDPPDGTILGPVKVTCDMQITGGNVVTMTGTIWVEGNFVIKNDAILKLDTTYGSSSGVVIADKPSDRLNSGRVSTENDSQVLGSGDPLSYVMLVSRNNSAEMGGGITAIDVKNDSAAPIFYAPHGAIDIQNDAALKEVSGYKLLIKNDAVVTYESGLANARFTSGPGASFQVTEWKEIP